MTRQRSFWPPLLTFILCLGIPARLGCGGGNPERPPPPDSPLAKVKIGMTDAQVRKILGDPDNANGYMTGKSWIPFYFGTDTGGFTDYSVSLANRVVEQWWDLGDQLWVRFNNRF